MPPESSVPPLPVNPDSLPQIGANQQEPGKPAAPQSSPLPIPATPPNKPFPIIKIAIGIGILIIVIGLTTAGFFLYQKTTNKDSTQNKSLTEVQTTPNSAVENSNQTNAQNTKQTTFSLPNVNLSSCLKWKNPNMFPEQIGEFFGGPYELTDSSSTGYYYKQKFEQFTPLQQKGNPVLTVALQPINSDPNFESKIKNYELPETKAEAIKRGIVLEVIQIGNLKLYSTSEKLDGKALDQNDQPIIGSTTYIVAALPELKAAFGFSYSDSNPSSTAESVSAKTNTLFNDWIIKVCQSK